MVISVAKFSRRLCNEKRIKAFECDMLSKEWNVVFNETDTNSAYEMLLKTITECYDPHSRLRR